MAKFFEKNTVTFLGRSGRLYVDTIGTGLKNIMQDQSACGPSH